MTMNNPLKPIINHCVISENIFLFFITFVLIACATIMSYESKNQAY